MADDITPQLVKQLERIRDDNLKPLERRLVDMAVWFHRNKEAMPRDNLIKRIDFLEKSLDIMIELVALCADRQQQVEGRKALDSLWLPAGLEIEDDDGTREKIRYR